MREERLRRRECDRLRREKLMKKRHTKLVNHCPCLAYEYPHFGNGTLGRQRANDRNRCAEQHKELEYLH